MKEKGKQDHQLDQKWGGIHEKRLKRNQCWNEFFRDVQTSFFTLSFILIPLSLSPQFPWHLLCWSRSPFHSSLSLPLSSTALVSGNTHTGWLLHVRTLLTPARNERRGRKMTAGQQTVRTEGKYIQEKWRTAKRNKIDPSLVSQQQQEWREVQELKRRENQWKTCKGKYCHEETRVFSVLSSHNTNRAIRFEDTPIHKIM